MGRKVTCMSESDAVNLTRADATGHEPTVMVVDDDPAFCQVACRLVRQVVGREAQGFTDPVKCLEAAASNPPDLLITDYSMPVMDGLKVLEQVKTASPATDVIIITGKADKDIAIRALKLGAYDFFEKPLRHEELRVTVQRAVAYRKLRTERDRFAEQVLYLSTREAQKWGIDAFVGKSDAVLRILDEIRLLQQGGRAAVLLTGESGTGKELVARAIHFGGPRTSRPFVPVNCCAVPGDLCESVFFGHVRGAFTGATTDRKGCFEIADGGTLFLDEIGDMPCHLQTKLLRVIEDGVVTPVGANKERKVDVRIVASTNADLRQRIHEGTFRADLYHRLAGFWINIPPLRERRSDIPLLARHFLAAFAHEMGLPAAPDLNHEAQELLQQYDYPGNVRELRNLMEQAIIRSEGRTIESAHLRIETGSMDRCPQSDNGQARQENDVLNSLPLNLQAAETELIKRAMRQAGGNMSKCAALLGVNRTKLYRKLAAIPSTQKEYGTTGAD